MRTLTRPGTYRPPRGGEPSRLREDGHWSTRDLVGYWPMNEGRGSVVQDVSPFGNHGTLTNMDPATDWVAGPDGAALDFNGTNNSISLPTQLPHLNGDSLSICAWIRYDGGNSRSICHQNWQGHAGIRFQLIMPFWTFTQQWNWTVCSGDTRASSLGPSPPTTGKWQHICGTYDGANVVLWIDAVAMAPTPLSGNINPNNAPLYLFTRGTDYYFNGLVAGLQFYNRALSADEIAALYRDPYLPLWRPRMGISLAMLAPAAGLPLITSRTLGRIGPSLRGLR